jgi:chemotaxis signal transduction protein
MPTPVRAESRQLAVAGQLRLVFSFAETREYVDDLVLTRVPRSPPWLLGVFGSNGVAVPLIDLDAWAHNTLPQPQTRHRALRMGDGSSAWAIALDASPSVVALQPSNSLPFSTQLPFSVSSMNGHLMPHVSRVWKLQDGFAAQVNWSELLLALKQELSGALAV